MYDYFFSRKRDLFSVSRFDGFDGFCSRGRTHKQTGVKVTSDPSSNRQKARVGGGGQGKKKLSKYMS